MKPSWVFAGALLGGIVGFYIQDRVVKRLHGAWTSANTTVYFVHEERVIFGYVYRARCNLARKRECGRVTPGID